MLANGTWNSEFNLDLKKNTIYTQLTFRLENNYFYELFIYNGYYSIDYSFFFFF